MSPLGCTFSTIPGCAGTRRDVWADRQRGRKADKSKRIRDALRAVKEKGSRDWNIAIRVLYLVFYEKSPVQN